MTENEAIKELKYIKRRCDDEGRYRDCDALEMAIQALEKQIPKKPLHNGANWYRCPNGCEVHKKTFEKDWYCPKCGQRLECEHDGE